MCSKYLDRAKDVMIVNLIKEIMRAPFGEERQRYAKKRDLLGKVLHEIAKEKTRLYEETVPRCLSKLKDTEDDHLLFILCFINYDQTIWDWLDESIRQRIGRLFEVFPIDKLLQNKAFSMAKLHPALLARFEQSDEATCMQIMSSCPRPEFATKAISLYSKALGWRHAETLGEQLIIPMAEYFAASAIQQILEAAKENEQIWAAAGTPEILERLFDSTPKLWNDTEAYWWKYVNGIATMYGDNRQDWGYACPGIRKKLEALKTNKNTK